MHLSKLATALGLAAAASGQKIKFSKMTLAYTQCSQSPQIDRR